MDSADHPLDGKRWWMESDEIWQTLACCIELTNAIRSNDPHNYVSHMPIHQDGSCNGLQHYAALGRDVLGAKSVNLLPAKYPQDVYSDVANLVQLQINSDLENNVDIAKIVDGFVSRKIVKHTVMTYVYGVTKYGAKLQVLKRLKEDPKFPEAHKVTASLYLSEKIFHSIRQMFTQTRKIQDWLTNCAQIISTDYQNTVEWVTPIGFPVYQSYFKSLKSVSLRSAHSRLFSRDNNLQYGLFVEKLWTQIGSKHDEAKECISGQFYSLIGLHSYDVDFTGVSPKWTHICLGT